MATVKLKIYVFLILLAGLVNTEINAESTKDAKDIFQKLNKRLKHGTFDNIKIDFKSIYSVSIKNPESGKIESKERWMYTSLIRKGNLFIQNDRFFVDGNHETNMNLSWNGAFSVSYDEHTQYFRDKNGMKNNNKDFVCLSQKERTVKSKNYLFNAFHLRGKIGIDTAFTEFYLKDGSVLLAGSSDNRIREEIHLTDIENALYSKIETYSDDKLVQTHLVKEWTKIDERYVPKKTILMNDGKIIDIFELNSIEFDPDYTNENFTLKIPYSDELFTYNQDIHEYLGLSRMDKQLWENGDYIDAFYDAYYRSMERIFLEPLEAEHPAAAMPEEDENKVSASEAAVDERTAKNNKEDIIGKPDNNTEISASSKVNPLFYVMGGLLLLGAIRFMQKTAVKNRK